MFRLDLTLPDAAANLACDEALLDWCEADVSREILRFWRPDNIFVVVGYGNQVDREVRVDVCRKRNIPIFRRCSGGGTVVQFPGCLNYSLVLQIDRHPDLASITGANKFIMERNRGALEAILGRAVTVQGHTDLTLDQMKFSGNAQRRRRRALLFHGAFLIEGDLAIVGDLLPMPSRPPEYRTGRPHGEFIRTLPLPCKNVMDALARSWQADEAPDSWPREATAELAREKYLDPGWRFKT